MAINVNKTRYTFLSFISLFTGSPSSFAQSLTRMIHKSFVRDPVSKEREHCSSCSPPILYTTSSTTTSSRLLSKDSSVRYYPDRIPKEKFGEREKLSREKLAANPVWKKRVPQPEFHRGNIFICIRASLAALRSSRWLRGSVGKQPRLEKKNASTYAPPPRNIFAFERELGTMEC